MTANPGGGDYRPDEPVCSICGHGTTAPHAICEPCRVAQDATDATETPARTPGGSGTAEARTEAQGEYQCPDPDCTREHLFIDVGLSDKMLVEHGGERESATDPGMTNEHAELVALRAQVERAERHWKQWMDRALTAETERDDWQRTAKGARQECVETLDILERTQAAVDRVRAMCDARDATFRPAMVGGSTPDALLTTGDVRKALDGA